MKLAKWMLVAAAFASPLRLACTRGAGWCRMRFRGRNMPRIASLASPSDSACSPAPLLRFQNKGTA